MWYYQIDDDFLRDLDHYVIIGNVTGLAILNFCVPNPIILLSVLP